MADQPISGRVVAFLTQEIESVVQLEVLLLLQSRCDRDWSAEEAGRELRVDAAWARGQMEYLCSRGLLAVQESSDSKRRYRYAPATAELEATILELAGLYSHRRVTVISLVYSKPLDPVRRLADAFRIRKEPGQEKHDGR